MSKQKKIDIRFAPLPWDIWEKGLHLSLSALRLFGYLSGLRMIYGIVEAALSDDELLNGRKFANGDRMDRGCGVRGKNNLKQAKKQLRDLGWMTVKVTGSRRGKVATYELVILNVAATRQPDLPFTNTAKNDPDLRSETDLKDATAAKIKGPNQTSSNEFEVRNGPKNPDLRSETDLKAQINTKEEKNLKEEPKICTTPSAGASKSDPRFAAFVKILFDYHGSRAEVELPFDVWFGPAGGVQLNRVLRKYPALDQDLFGKCVLNRARSPDVRHAQPVPEWIGFILDWTSPKVAIPLSNGNGTRYVSKQEQRERANDAIFESVFGAESPRIRSLPAGDSPCIPDNVDSERARLMGGRPFRLLSGGSASGD